MDSPSIISLALSLRVALVATLLVGMVGIGLAYLTARRRFWGKEFLDMLLTLPLVLPPTVIGYYLIIICGRNGVLGGPLYAWTGWTIMFTWYAAVLASAVVALPLLFKTARAAMEAVDENLIRASYTLGRSEWETFWRIILPLSWKGICAGGILAFARAMGEFGATLMLAGNIPGKTATAPLAIYSLAAGGDWPQAHLLALVFTSISLAFLFAANHFGRRTFS